MTDTATSNLIHTPFGFESTNAGAMALPDLELTPRGWEMQFATNHLGHFALALTVSGSYPSRRSGRRAASTEP